MKKIRMIELFAGYGSQAMAMKRTGYDFDHYKVVEFDKYAVKSYNAVHGTNFETLDITKVSAKDLGIEKTDEFNYLMTYSFPCTDLSTAGAMKGMSKGSGTRSGLLWEVERLIEECEELPQVLIMENVPQIIGKNNIDDFKAWCNFLESKGYQNYYDIINAIEVNVPQTRRRCFMISYLPGSSKFDYRSYEKIKKIFETEEKLTVQKLLEDEVEEKYYLNQETSNRLISTITEEEKSMLQELNFCQLNKVTKTGEFAKLKDGSIINLNTEQCGTITSRYSNGIGGNRDNMVLVKQATKKGFIECNVPGVADLSFPDSKTRRGRVTQNGDISPTLQTTSQPSYIDENLRIRRLTPRECGRLMDVSEEDISKMLEVNSNTQCYKQFGNSIVVRVLEEIIKEIYKEDKEIEGQLTIQNYMDQLTERKVM